MVKLFLSGLQFNFSQNLNLLLKDTEKNVSLSLPPPTFSLLVLISLISSFLYLDYKIQNKFYSYFQLFINTFYIIIFSLFGFYKVSVFFAWFFSKDKLTKNYTKPCLNKFNFAVQKLQKEF